MSKVTIYHNPNCGTSRNTLKLLRHAGLEPEVIEYLKTPPSKETLIGLLFKMNMTARELLREKGTPYAELQLDLPHWSEEDLIDKMVEHPILMNRPIVLTALGARLCRPSERVLELLPVPKIEPFQKEDGEMLLDDGLRLGQSAEH
jgi:arsenate reductase (glutaredoxin)